LDTLTGKNQEYELAITETLSKLGWVIWVGCRKKAGSQLEFRWCTCWESFPAPMG